MGNYDKVGVERERYADMFTYDEPAGRRGKFFAGVTAPVIFIRSFAPDHDDSGLRIFVCNASLRYYQWLVCKSGEPTTYRVNDDHQYAEYQYSYA